MARLHALRAQQVGPTLFLNQLARQLDGGQCKDEAFEGRSRLRFDDEVAPG